jgi:hypothetical protein
MTRWIDGHIPAWLLLFILALGIVGGGLLTQTVVRRRLPALANESHNDAIRFAYGFIGLFYTFFIGFLVSSMWAQTNSAYDAARSEGALATQLAIDLHSFDNEDQARLRADLLGYERSAIAEWDRADSVRLPETDAALIRVYQSYRQVNPSTDAEKGILTSSLANLDVLSQARTVRLLTVGEDQGLGWALWTVVWLTSLLVVGTAIVYGVEHPAMHYPMVAVVGLIVAANLFIIVELSYPYVGAMSMNSDPLQAAARLLTQTAR